MAFDGKRQKRKPAQAAAETEENTPQATMTVWRARRTVVSALQNVQAKNEFTWGAGYKVRMHLESIRVNAKRVECTAEVGLQHQAQSAHGILRRGPWERGDHRH